MIDLNLFQIQIAMAGGIFLIGTLTFFIGVIVLIKRSAGRDIREIANQTVALAEKGVAHDVAGLVGNASALLNATNELMRNTAGVGIFLTLLGVTLMTIATWLVLQISF
ncbi:MAG: hypothetical protein IBX69_03395 [Anaerolineales bacterium]|nr:hypothetical protein [Anaerolineales bacterium]